MNFGRVRTNVRDSGDILVALVLLVVVSVLALGVNPYTVLFAVPALHAWLWLSSMQVHDRRILAGIWLLGLSGPALAVLAIGSRFDLGAGAPWYLLELVQTRTVPPMLGLLAGAASGLAGLLLVATLGRVAHPALPTLRRLVAGTARVHEIERAPRAPLQTQFRELLQTLGSLAAAPRRARSAQKSTQQSRSRSHPRVRTGRSRSEEQRAADRRERDARRAADRPRVKSR